jgi:hypothetical protein
MARDKAKRSGAMRTRMINLRSGEPTATPTTTTTRQPLLGRGGERTGGSGRVPQTIHLSDLINEQDKKPEVNAISATTTVATGTTETATTRTQMGNISEGEGGTPTISNLTEPTNDAEEDMDKEVNMLKLILKQGGIPSEIENFTPNTKSTEDMEENLPKKRYRVEIKIAPASTPIETNQPPKYYHPRIFKAITPALLTAAPSTAVCSIEEDEDTRIYIEDIPTTQMMVNRLLESPIVNPKTHSYHA